MKPLSKINYGEFFLYKNRNGYNLAFLPYPTMEFNDTLIGHNSRHHHKMMIVDMTDATVKSLPADEMVQPKKLP